MMTRTNMSWCGSKEQESGILTLTFPTGDKHSLPLNSFREARELYRKIIDTEEIVEKNTRVFIKYQFNRTLDSL